GGVVGLRVTGGAGASSVSASNGNPTQVITSAKATARPIEQVWPQAVVRMPLKAPNGRDLRPITLIDDQTLLVAADRDFERAEAVYAYPLAGGELRKIADVPEPKGTLRFASGFSVGDGQVVWWTTTKGRTHIWAASLDGARARPVADQDMEGFDGFGVADGKAVFSPVDGGVFTVPLTGGKATRIPAGDGQYLLSWPWAGSPGTGGGRDKPLFTRLVNLETGKVDSAAVGEDERVYACGVRSCIGMTADERAFVRLRDGSQQRDVPVGYQIPEPPRQDRFHLCNVKENEQGLGLYDVNTGTVVDLGLREEVANGGIPVTDPTGRIMSYRLKGELHVIVLPRIP
ncbi:TolB family protein, partial [Streptosporangium algeriense]